MRISYMWLESEFNMNNTITARYKLVQGKVRYHRTDLVSRFCERCLLGSPDLEVILSNILLQYNSIYAVLMENFLDDLKTIEDL